MGTFAKVLSVNSGGEAMWGGQWWGGGLLLTSPVIFCITNIQKGAHDHKAQVHMISAADKDRLLPFCKVSTPLQGY